MPLVPLASSARPSRPSPRSTRRSCTRARHPARAARDRRRRSRASRHSTPIPTRSEPRQCRRGPVSPNGVSDVYTNPGWSRVERFVPEAERFHLAGGGVGDRARRWRRRASGRAVVPVREVRSIVTERFPAAMNSEVRAHRIRRDGDARHVGRHLDAPGNRSAARRAPRRRRSRRDIRPVYAAASDDTSTTRTPSSSAVPVMRRAPRACASSRWRGRTWACPREAGVAPS